MKKQILFLLCLATTTSVHPMLNLFGRGKKENSEQKRQNAARRDNLILQIEKRQALTKENCTALNNALVQASQAHQSLISAIKNAEEAKDKKLKNVWKSFKNESQNNSFFGDFCDEIYYRMIQVWQITKHEPDDIRNARKQSSKAGATFIETLKKAKQAAYSMPKDCPSKETLEEYIENSQQAFKNMFKQK